jgi:phage-related protein
MRDIQFYRTQTDHSPVEDFLDSLSGSQAAKIAWVLQLVEELDMVPKQYFKKLTNTEDLWEVRVQVGRNTFRLLGFLDGSQLVILDHAFAKKSQKIPKSDITIAESRKRDYFRRKLK